MLQKNINYPWDFHKNQLDKMELSLTKSKKY